ncbi:MAG: hypothetical protein PHE03_06200 [Bacteroidales bacterium]|nr:hypothetical protein [Bacteroidales bacterium]MDD3891879.1 hypothetical protein [Bacteroidales bacterium]
MKRMTLFILLTGALLGGLTASAQQTYKTGLGLKGGYPSGVTVKHFLDNRSAVEGIASFGWGGFGITGLYQFHNPIPDLPGLSWYYGGGAHLAIANDDDDDDNPWRGEELTLGIDGVIGLEYVFAEAPISIGIDILPVLNIIQKPGVWFNSGIAIRYTFK